MSSIGSIPSSSSSIDGGGITLSSIIASLRGAFTGEAAAGAVALTATGRFLSAGFFAGFFFGTGFFLATFFFALLFLLFEEVFFFADGLLFFGFFFVFFMVEVFKTMQ